MTDMPELITVRVRRRLRSVRVVSFRMSRGCYVSRGCVDVPKGVILLKINGIEVRKDAKLAKTLLVREGEKEVVYMKSRFDEDSAPLVVAAVPSASLGSSVQDGDLDDDEDEKAKLSCDLIRRKIKAFLGTKEMTKIEFLRIIGCNFYSFGRFMSLKGAWNGTQNGVYWGAQRFFIKREEKAKVAKAALPKADRKRKATEEAREKAEKKLRLSSLLTSLDAIQLDNDNVYDDCDDIRKKSNEFIAAHCPSLSDWNKAIGNVESKQWDNFMGHKGAGAGAGCKSYVNAYILLEKYRIHKGAAKSAKRLRNENENPDGFPLKSDNGMRYVFQGKFGHAIVFRKFQREDQRPK